MDQINTLENTNINIDIDNDIVTVSLFHCFTVSMFNLPLQLCSVYSSRWSSLWTADLPVGVFDLNTLEYFQHSET